MIRPRARTRAGRSRPPEPESARGLGGGLRRLAVPALAGLALDALDLATFGPIGLWLGIPLGGALGFWLAPELGFPRSMRWLCSALAGLYCALPMTGFLPMATVAAGLARALARPPPTPRAASDPALDPEGAIETDSISRRDGPPSR